jgi:hypothetical protein
MEEYIKESGRGLQGERSGNEVLEVGQLVTRI